ncbi:dipeptide epimerase [Hydrogenimonas sp.]
MRVAGYRLSALRLPLETPFVTALRRVEAAEAVRLVLTDQEGHEGVGEAPPTVAITGESLEDIRRTLETVLLPPLKEASFGSMEEVQERLNSLCRGHSSAKACLDIALHNLFARREGVPLWRWLGGTPAERETAVTVSLASPVAMAEQAERFVRRGYRNLKVKAGGRDGQDAARIEAVRYAAPEAALWLDANQAWSEREAIEILETTAPLGIELVEQPLRAENLAGMRRLAAMSPVPVVADESAFTLEAVRRVIQTGAAHMVNVKLMKCGGIFEARRILDWCERHGVACMMGSMLETPASIAAALALASAYPDTVRYLDLDSPMLYAHLPEGSGLFVEADRVGFTKMGSRMSRRPTS